MTNDEFAALKARIKHIMGQLDGVEVIAKRLRWTSGGHWVTNVAADSKTLIADLVSALNDQTETALRWRRIAEGGKGTATEPHPPKSSESA